MADNSVLKHEKGKQIRSGERRCVLCVFNTLCQNNPEMTSQATEIGKAGVYRFRTKANANNNTLSSLK
jgi:hypothetical protein